MAESGGPTPRVRVVWGIGTASTAVASYDAALADANVHDYNLATVSSIVPEAAAVEAVGTAPDLGPAGHRLWAVLARGTVVGPGRASAALGWATGEGAGLLYEAGGVMDEAAAREEVMAGLAAARGLRNRSLPDDDCRSATLSVPEGTHGTAVVLGVFGRAEPLL